MPEAIAVAVADYFAFEVGVTVAQAALIETAVSAVVSAAISTAVSAGVQALSSTGSSGQGGTVSSRQLSTVLRDSSTARRLIFGEVKIGGVLDYVAQSADGADCHLCIYLSEGKINGVAPVFWIGEDLTSLPKFTGLTTLEVKDGGAGQVASATLIAASGGEWTSAAVGNGIAYVHTKYIFEKNAFPQGLVFPAFLARGIECLDLRTGLTVFTKNQSLVQYWYLKEVLNQPDIRIDLPSFIAAANVCDEILDSIDPLNIVNGVPNKVRRYEINGVFELSASPKTISDTISQSCGGALVDTDGKYHFYAGTYRPATGNILTEQFLRAPPSRRTHASRTQRVDVVRGRYREPRQDWQTIDYIEQRLAPPTTEDDAVQTLDLPVTTNGAMAQRLAKQALRRANSALPLVLQCNMAALQWKRYDVVSVNLPEIGAVGEYLINEYEFKTDGGIDMVCVPHLASDYAWNHLTDEQLVPVLVRPNFNTNPPALTTLLVSGDPYTNEFGVNIRLTANWTAPAWVRSAGFLVQWKLHTDPTYVKEVSVTESTYESIIDDVVPLGVYDVRVRMFSTDGSYGAWTEAQSIIVKIDTMAPAAPTTLSVTGAGLLAINWKNPIDADFKEAKIYINTSNNTIGATLLASKIGLANANDSYNHTPGAVRFYWVQARDTSGNESALTYAGTGT
jgi:Putative phage tail protein